MSSFRKYLSAQRCQIGFVFHLAVLVPISSRAGQISNPDIIPARCTQGVETALPAEFQKTAMWSLLRDLDALELLRAQKGWTSDQQNCVAKIKAQGEAWINNYSGKPSAEVWAFRSGFLFYTNPNKSLALAAAIESEKLGASEHALAQYYKALSLRHSQTKEINDALIGASISLADQPFEVLLRRRAMFLLRQRLRGAALLGVAKQWAKFYPRDIDVMLTYFDSAIQTKSIESAEEIFKALAALDLSNSETSEPALRAAILSVQGKYQDASLIYKSLLEEPTLSAARRTNYQKHYLDAVAALGSWKEVRRTLESLLPLDPMNGRYRDLLDQSINGGAVDAAAPIDDLEKALALNPDSFTIKYALAKILINEFENGARQDKANLIGRAETLTSQLSFVRADAIDVAYLNARVLFLKKIFSKAENEIAPAVTASKKRNATFQTPIVDLYDIAARIAWARGDWGEAKRLIREGITRVSLRAEKGSLQALLRQIP